MNCVRGKQGELHPGSPEPVQGRASLFGSRFTLTGQLYRCAVFEYSSTRIL